MLHIPQDLGADRDHGVVRQGDCQHHFHLPLVADLVEAKGGTFIYGMGPRSRSPAPSGTLLCVRSSSPTPSPGRLGWRTRRRQPCCLSPPLSSSKKPAAWNLVATTLQANSRPSSAHSPMCSPTHGTLVRKARCMSTVHAWLVWPAASAVESTWADIVRQLCQEGKLATPCSSPRCAWRAGTAMLHSGR